MDLPTTVVRTRCPEPILEMIKGSDDEKSRAEKMLRLPEDIIKLKQLMKNTFEAYSYCEPERFPVELRFLAYEVEDVETLGRLAVLKPSPFKQCTVHVNNSY